MNHVVNIKPVRPQQTAAKLSTSTRLNLVTSAAQTRSDSGTRSRYSLLQLWHLCSLDAPTVAAVWTAFIAENVHVRLPWTTLISMFLAVWVLYAADRLLDARAGDNHEQLEARHHFHYRHRRKLLAGMTVCCVVLSLLIRRLTTSELRLFSSVGALLIAYFFLIHMWSGSSARGAVAKVSRLPKEFAVGVFFSAAVFVPTVVRVPELRSTLLPAACMFAALCTMNCLYVYAWEHPHDSPGAHWSTRFASEHLGITTLCSVVLCGCMLLSTPNPVTRMTATACLMSLLCIACLHHFRAKLHALTIRAGVDFALLVSIPVLAYVHLR